jgi:hypothetical protein
MSKWFPAARAALALAARLAVRPHLPAAARRAAARRPRGVESLEGRQLFSVSLDAAGFTVVTPEAGDRVLYVSSSAGSDANAGTSAAAPYKTIAKAKAMMRANTGDQLLLKRGDTFYETFGYWAKGGASAAEPMVIGAYGDGDRPVVATGTASALALGSSSGKVINHIVVQGIRFYAHQRDPANPAFTGGYNGNEGLRLIAATNDTLLEDCAVDGYTTNVTVSNYFGPASNVRIRRCQITDAYNLQGHASGLYAEKVDGLLLEENTFDHNGWESGVAAAVKTMYNHGAYVRESVTGFVARGNLFSNSASHGMQARSGGVVENNTFLNNPIGLSFGLVNGSPVTPGGVSGRVAGNLFQGTSTINGLVRGYGVEMGNLKRGGDTVVSGNVFRDVPANSGYAISLTYGGGVTNQSQAVGINDLTITGNVVHNWTRGVYVNKSLVGGGSGYNGINNVKIVNNDFQQIQQATVLYVGGAFASGQVALGGNRYHSVAGAVLINVGTSAPKFSTWGSAYDPTSAATLVSYLDASRTATSYATSVGLSGESALVAKARRPSGVAWDPAVAGSPIAAHVKEGFGVL